MARVTLKPNIVSGTPSDLSVYLFMIFRVPYPKVEADFFYVSSLYTPKTFQKISYKYVSILMSLFLKQNAAK